MKTMSQTEFSELMDQRPVFLLGAGASMPLLPTVDKIKKALVDYLLENSTVTFSKRPPNDVRDLCVRDALYEQIGKPHLTLELLCSLFAYRAGVADGHRRFNAARLWHEICHNAGYGVIAFCLAALAQRGKVGPLLTSNFDKMLFDAASHLAFGFQLVTDRSLRLGTNICRDRLLVAFHGTTHGIDPDALEASEHSPPTSALARGLATPFSRELVNCLKSCIGEGDRPVICIGYSGNDHYDMNPLLNSLEAVVREHFYWLCHSGNAADVSKFVQKRFSDRLFAGKAADLLAQHCATSIPEQTEVKDLSARLSKILLDSSWRSKLFTVLHGFKIPPERCDTLISDLLRNLPGTFAVLEHYYLYSIAYLESETLVFAGVEQTQDGFSADHLRFFDLPFDELLLGQYVYRNEDRERSRFATRREQSLYNYPETTRRFSKALSSIRLKILKNSTSGEDSSSFEILPEYRAVWHVGVAIAYDYLGLVANKRLQALEAWSAELNDQPGNNNDFEKRIVENEIKSARTLALTYFAACEEYALVAQRLIESSRDRLDQWLLEQLVQARTWIMIGKDNRARAASRKRSYQLFRSAIRYRERELKRTDDPEYEAAHYPQLWLRASEWLKKLLDIRSDQEAFCKDLVLDEHEERLLKDAVRVLNEADQRYQARVGGVNSRLPAVFDAQLLHVAWTMRGKAASDRQDALTKVIDDMNARLGEASGQVREEITPWIRNIQVRRDNLGRL